jgi:PAS domain S-box-containing protein
MASRLLHAQSWPDAVPQCRGMAARAEGADGAMLFEYRHNASDAPLGSRRFAWRRDGIEPQKPVHARVEGPLAATYAAHCRGEMVHGAAGELMASGCAVPETDPAESVAAAPVMMPDGCWGFVCFTRSNGDAWTEGALATLHLAAHVLGAAIARQRAETERASSRAHVRAVLDNIPHPAWVKNVEGRYAAANRAFARSCGRTIPEILGMTDRQLFPGPQAEHTNEEDLRVMGLGQSRTSEEQVLEAAGAVWYETFKTPIRDNTGRVVGTAGLSQNVSGRRRMEEELSRSEERYRGLLAALSDLVLIIDPNGTLVSVYASAPELAGTQSRLIGRNIRDLLPPDRADESLALLEETQRTGLSQACEICLPSDGRITRHYEARTAPAGQCQTLAVLRNVTAARLAEQERTRMEQLLLLQKSSGAPGAVMDELCVELRELAARGSAAVLETAPGGRARHALARVLQSANRSSQLAQKLACATPAGQACEAAGNNEAAACESDPPRGLGLG